MRESKINLRNLPDAVQREALRAIGRKGVTHPCPCCGVVFHMRYGANRCPHCGKSIDLRTELTAR